MARRQPHLAICLLAFDRPRYFRQVVQSVRRQPDLGDVSVHCFLDGAFNPQSRTWHTRAERIRQCARLFSDAFPGGELHASSFNLGIALNYERAERHLFLTSPHAYVLFLEDDFVLEPHYLSTIRALIDEFGHNPRVGAFNAFGDHDASLAEQRAHCRTIKSMGHSWAYCVPRRRWLEWRPVYSRYLRYVRRFDYVMRPHNRILRLYRRWGAGPIATSQDTAKRIAMLKVGQIQLSTYTNNGRYIGREGTHFSPSVFRRLGYLTRSRLVFPEAQAQFRWTSANLDRIEAAQRAYFLCS